MHHIKRVKQLIDALEPIFNAVGVIQKAKIKDATWILNPETPDENLSSIDVEQFCTIVEAASDLKASLEDKENPAPSKYPLVLIEWTDAHSMNEWAGLDELKSKTRLMRCKSVGWLVAYSEGSTLIVPHIAEMPELFEEDGSGSMAIPNHAIVSTIKLIEATVIDD